MKRIDATRTLVATLAIAATATWSLAQVGPPAGGPPQGPGGFQRGPGGPGGPGMQRGQGSGMMLVQMKSVQRELKLTADQVQKISELRPRQGPGGPGGPPPGGQGGAGRPPQGGPPQGGPPQGGAGRPPQGGPPQGGPGGFERRGPGGPQGGPLAGILDESQMRRLHQLILQFDAPMTLLGADRELQLTEEQRKKLHDIVQGILPRPQGGPEAGPRGGRPGGQGGQPGQPGQQGQPPRIDFKAMQAKKAAGMKEALEVLTSQQRQQWSKMVGAEFTQWEEPKPPRG